MRFAIADEDGAIGIAEDTMRAGHFAAEGIAIGAIALLIEPGDEFEVAGFRVHHADGMAFAVGEPRVAFGVDGDAFRAAERGFFGGAAIAGEAAFAGAGDVEDLSGLEVEFEDLVPLACGEPEIALLVEIERAWAFERRAADGRAIGRRARFAHTGKGADRAGFHIDLADDVVADVADIQIALRSKLDAVRLLELGVLRRTTIAAVTRLAVSSDGGDDLGLEVDFAHGVVGHVHDVEIAFRIETQFVRQIEGGLQRRPTIAAVTFGPGARDGADRAIRRHTTDALPGVFAEPDRAVRAAHDAEGIVDRGLRRGAAIAITALHAGAGKGRDRPLGGGQQGAGSKEQGKKRGAKFHGGF